MKPFEDFWLFYPFLATQLKIAMCIFYATFYRTAKYHHAKTR